MNYKDIVKKDITDNFFDFEIFGETHIINDRELIVIIDNIELIERNIKVKSLSEGVYTKQLLFYVSAEAYGSLPIIGRIMLFDNNAYEVKEAIDEQGIYSITLEAVRDVGHSYR